MNKTILSVLLASVCILPAQAGELSILLGSSRAQLASSGTWWQQEYPHELSNNPVSGTLRYDWSSAAGSKYAIGLTHIGRWTSSAQAVASDNAYTIHSPYPLSHWYGDESINGLFLAARHDTGNWSFEYGPILTHTSWRMQVPDWMNCVDSAESPEGRALGGGCLTPVGYIWPVDIQVPNQWGVTWRLGLSYRFSQNYRSELSCIDGRMLRNGPGLVNGPVCTFNLGYTFK